MTKKRIIAFAVAVLLLLGAGSAAASGSAGTSADPLISLQYIKDVYIASITAKWRELISSSVSGGEAGSTGSFSQVSLKNGDKLTLSLGGSVILTTGSASLSITSGAVINITRGEEAKSGPVNRYERYMAAEDTAAVLTATSDSVVSFDGSAVYTPGTPQDVSFTDVPSSHWANSYVEKLASAGYINGTGDGLFSPSNNMTRADFVTILGRIAGVSADDFSGSSFSDVSASMYYAPYVEWASQNGIVSGVGGGNFAPASNLTRSQMAAIICRYADFAGITLSVSGDSTPFADDSSIESWARTAVYTARGAGIINGRDNNIFDPQGNASRAEVCAVICRLIYG